MGELAGAGATATTASPCSRGYSEADGCGAWLGQRNDWAIHPQHAPLSGSSVPGSGNDTVSNSLAPVKSQAGTCGAGPGPRCSMPALWLTAVRPS